MAGQPVPVPVRDTKSIILCVEDIRKSALKKLPKGVAGMHFIHVLYTGTFLRFMQLSDANPVLASSYQFSISHRVPRHIHI